MKHKKRAHEKPLVVPLDFNEAIRRALQVKPPEAHYGTRKRRKQQPLRKKAG